MDPIVLALQSWRVRVPATLLGMFLFASVYVFCIAQFDSSAASASLFPGDSSTWKVIAHDVCSSASEPLSRILYRVSEDVHLRFGNMTSEKRVAYVNGCSTPVKGCASLSIRNGRLYVRSFTQGYNTRIQAMVSMIYRLVSRYDLPDSDFVIDTADGAFSTNDMPILLFDEFRGEFESPIPHLKRQGIAVPDFTQYTWPQSTCPNETTREFNYVYDTMAHMESYVGNDLERGYDEWISRDNEIFWIGTISGGRTTWVPLVNATHFPTDYPTINVSNTIRGPEGRMNCVTVYDQCAKRYLLHFNGMAYSSRLKYLLMCGSTVIMGHQRWREWFYDELIPDVHYVELHANYSNFETIVSTMIEGGTQHAFEIGARGQSLIFDLLSQQSRDCFWVNLIHAMSTAWGTVESESLIPIEDVLMYFNNNFHA